MRRLVEHRAPEPVVAGVAGDSHVSHAPAALGGLTCWRADAWSPAHLTVTRPERMAERAALRLVLEHGDGHRMIMPARRKLNRTPPETAAGRRGSMPGTSGVGKLSPMIWAWLNNIAMLIGIPASVAFIVQFVRPVVRRGMSRRADRHAELLAPMTLTVATPSPDGPSPAIAPCRSIASYMANSSQTRTITFGSECEYYINGIRQPALSPSGEPDCCAVGLPNTLAVTQKLMMMLAPVSSAQVPLRTAVLVGDSLTTAASGDARAGSGCTGN